MKVGLVLQTDDDVDVGRRAARFSALRELAQRVEAAGFDSLWLYDHLLYRYAGKPSQGTWECWTILAALAAVTERVALGTLVSCTGYRNPALLAKMADTVDEISGGRLILGLGAGWHQPEYAAFGYPFDHRIDRFEEALQIIVPLLRAGHVDFAGRYYQAADCTLLPRGPRPQGPPILIGGQGPRLLDLTARYADSWNIGFTTPPETAIPRMQAACMEQGRDPATLELTLLRIVAFPAQVALPANFPPYLSGPAESLAAALSNIAALGIGHLMLECTPTTADTLRTVTDALHLFRQRSAD